MVMEEDSIYPLLFMFCLIDQRTKTGSGREGYIETFRNMTGSIMAVILLSHCKWERSGHISFLICSGRFWVELWGLPM